jgi:hypothetical protein
MKAEHLNKLFVFFGVVTIIIAANTWLSSQGGKAVFSIALIADERPAMVFIGLAVVGVLLAVTAGVGSLHAIRHGTRWSERIPSTWLEGFCPTAPESVIYQGAIFVIFIIFPLAALIHFTDVLMSSKLCVLGQEAQPVPVSSAWWRGIPDAKDQVRLLEALTPAQDEKGTTRYRCQKGIQVFPPVEFVAIFFVDVIAGLLSLFFFVSLFWDRSKKREESDKDHTQILKQRPSERPASPRGYGSPWVHCCRHGCTVAAMMVVFGRRGGTIRPQPPGVSVDNGKAAPSSRPTVIRLRSGRN